MLPFSGAGAKKKSKKKNKTPVTGYLKKALNQKAYRQLLVNSNYGFLRAGPGSTYARIRRMRLNERLRYLGDTGKLTSIENLAGVFMLVSYKKKRGYFFSAYTDIPLTTKMLKRNRWQNSDRLGASIRFKKKRVFELHRPGQNPDQGTYKIINGRLQLRMTKVETSLNAKYARMQCSYSVNLLHFRYLTALFCSSASAKVTFVNPSFKVPAGQMRQRHGTWFQTTRFSRIKMTPATQLYRLPNQNSLLGPFAEGFTSEDSMRYSFDLVKVYMLAKSTKPIIINGQEKFWAVVKLPVSNEGVTDFKNEYVYILLD